MTAADGVLGQEREVGPFKKMSLGWAHGLASWVFPCWFSHEVMVSI